MQFVKEQPAATHPVAPESADVIAATLGLVDNSDTTKPCTVLPPANCPKDGRSCKNSDTCIAFDSIPAGDLASDFDSEGFECCQVNEFGTGVDLRRPGKLTEVSFVLSSWGCQKRAAATIMGQAGVCTTKKGATFPVPITLSVYATCTPGSCSPNANSEVGTLIATQTRTFDIPYRPSDSPKSCPIQTVPFTNAFFDPVSRLCVHGLANKITFDLPDHVQVPASAIFTVAYNTTDQGYHPIGPKPCGTTLAGCGYDSLNVIADSTGGVSVGNYLDPSGVFVNFAAGSDYCDGGASGSGFLRIDTPCWLGYQPQLKVTIKT